MNPILNIAIRAARMAGNLIIRYYENSNAIQNNQKYGNDFVIKLKRNAEHLIIETIRKSYPNHIIISAAQNTVSSTATNIQWVIEPLDSTANFIRNFPHFAVSIAVSVKGRTEVSVVYDPMRNELFTSIRGEGAQLNGYRLRVKTAKYLDNTILATGFPLNIKYSSSNYLIILSKLLKQCVNFRCTGSPALDLAYVSAGRVDGFFQPGLKPWYFSGGECLVREANGLVTDFLGDHNYLKSGNIIAGNPRIVKAILANIRY
ncbi:inositol-1-monophosphatase [Candidatus Profftia sp. (ex Adelges kitamiensis)]|uniref:inositol-1-monophosphatase n=1 Tax=Candidatus Profftia sp. (ex Adelges kitamiensis) TaxID=2864218 RepID=UPI001CE3AC43|nr:inositol-1-monophosphatase [Candidatus Profftia sp. (ex Adelges kitamiensis)]